MIPQVPKLNKIPSIPVVPKLLTNSKPVANKERFKALHLKTTTLNETSVFASLEQVKVDEVAIRSFFKLPKPISKSPKKKAVRTNILGINISRQAFYSFILNRSCLSTYIQARGKLNGFYKKLQR